MALTAKDGTGIYLRVEGDRAAATQALQQRGIATGADVTDTFTEVYIPNTKENVEIVQKWARESSTLHRWLARPLVRD